MASLTGKVAIVTGASRGIGKGIALALGAERATVYVTGRTVTPGSYELSGTVGETAEEVDRRGGKGVPVQVDHRDDDQIARLFERVESDEGRLDILVNNAFALPEDLTEPKPFWEKPLSDWEMVDVGVRSNFVAARHAAKIMVPQRSGMIVAISGYVGATYTYGVLFGLCKAAVDRMARDMAIELQPHNVVSLSLWQGLTFTERAMRNLKRSPDMTTKTVTDPAVGCSPEFPGRVIAALAGDSDVMKLSGGTFTAELAQRYGVTDVDGTNRGRWRRITTCSTTAARSTVTPRTVRPTTCSPRAIATRRTGSPEVATSIGSTVATGSGGSPFGPTSSSGRAWSRLCRCRSPIRPTSMAMVRRRAPRPTRPISGRWSTIAKSTIQGSARRLHCGHARRKVPVRNRFRARRGHRHPHPC
jgi:NAD(P)-dependent dehydrogenase (short-subunit alcohol dehydrogenase family)